MRRTLLVAAVACVLLVAAVVKWLSSLAVEAKVDPGEVPGEMAVYLEPSSGRPKSVAEIHRLPDTDFRDYEDCCAFKSPQGPIWLRFKVTNNPHQLDSLHYSPSNERFTVELVNPFVPHVTFYQLSSHGALTDSIATGVAGRHYRDRPYSDANARNFRFPIVLPQDSSAWAYLRVEADMPLTFRVLFFKESDRLGHQQWMVDMMFAVFFVFCTLFLCLSAILIAVSREHFNWYYFLYILVTTLFIQAHIGWGFVHIWPNRPEWQAVVPMALNTLRLVFGIEFFRRYFDLQQSSPRFDRYVRASLKVFLVTLALQLVMPLFGLFRWVHYPFFLFLAAFCGAMVVWLIYKMLFGRKAYFLAVFLVIGLNFVGVLATSLQYLGYDPTLFDFTDDLFTYFGVANTFFLPPFVIAAFFTEMLLVFYFSVRRFVRLIEKNQKAELKIASAKAESLSALVVGAENERKRLARELHDGACVNLAAINMKMDTLWEDTAPSPALRKKVGEIAHDLDATYRELRGLSHGLMSKGLDKMGLAGALEELALHARQAQPSMEVQLYINYPLDEVNTLGRLHLYRIAQELVGNALKHAQAKHLNIQFLQSGEGLLLSVEDDGKGFDPGKDANGGIGLSNILARAEVLRAKVNIDTALGKGTFVSLEVPGESLVG